MADVRALGSHQGYRSEEPVDMALHAEALLWKKEWVRPWKIGVHMPPLSSNLEELEQTDSCAGEDSRRAVRAL